jgi:hypothetical protein
MVIIRQWTQNLPNQKRNLLSYTIWAKIRPVAYLINAIRLIVTNQSENLTVIDYP